MKKTVISLEGNRKLIYACKKAGLPLHNPRGEWNGYGYTRLPLAVTLTTPEEKKLFSKLKRQVKKTQKPQKSSKEQEILWVKRLNKLTGCGLNVAKLIAKEKKEYKEKQIEALEERQYERYSAKRSSLIRKIKRSNPLRTIRNKEHAFAILQAHNRHIGTDYEYKLKKAKELAKLGEIDRGDVREFARKNMKKMKFF